MTLGVKNFKRVNEKKEDGGLITNLKLFYKAVSIKIILYKKKSR